MKYIVLLLLYTTSSYLGAQDHNMGTFNKAKMDSLFNLIEQNDKGMGSLSLVYDGQEIYHKAIGYANIEKNIKADKNTTYRIGSISKTITATLIMKLIEDNTSNLKLKTTLDQYFPTLPHADKITIKHLLGHRSGLYNYTMAADYKSWFQDTLTREEQIARFIQYGTTSKPGKQYEYSNTNYVLLSYIIEDITKKSYAEAINDMIAEDHDLKHVYDGQYSTDNEAFSYKKMNTWMLRPSTNLSIAKGAGSIVATSTDVSKFYDLLFSEQLVKKSTLKDMMDTRDGCGLGLFTYPFYNETIYGHRGRIDGFSSFAVHFPKDKLSVTYLSNGTLLMTPNDILLAVLKIYFDKHYALPQIQIISLGEKELLPYEGLYTSPAYPMDIRVFIDRSDSMPHLKAQATGQDAFGLECTDKHTFTFDPTGVEMIFSPEENSLILKQSGRQYKLKRSTDSK